MPEIEVETWDGELNELRREVARLRAGESDQPAPEGTQHTPAEWIHRWNRATTEQRLERVGRILDDSAAAERCWLMDHFGRLDHLQRAEMALVRGRFLHPSREELAATGPVPLCPECIAPAPCKTRRILDGQE